MTATIPVAVAVPPEATHRARRAPWVVIVGTAILLVAMVKLVGVFRLESGANQLRDSWQMAVGQPTKAVAQFSVGPGLVSMARVILPWINEVPPEAGLALAAVRHASVGIYEIQLDDFEPSRNRWMTAADRAMRRDGWTRALGVVSDDSVVVIYVADGAAQTDDLRVAIGVCDGENLVVINGEMRIAPLLEIVERRVDWADVLGNR